MKIDILTLFPDMFDGFLSESIIGRAIKDRKVEINIYNIRNYSNDPHKKVDDYPFGGGKGMVLMPQPICADKEFKKTRFLLLNHPIRRGLQPKKAYELKNKNIHYLVSL